MKGLNSEVGTLLEVPVLFHSGEGGVNLAINKTADHLVCSGCDGRWASTCGRGCLSTTCDHVIGAKCRNDPL